MAADEQGRLSQRASWLPGAPIWLTRGDEIVDSVRELAQESAELNEQLRRAATNALESTRVTGRHGAALRKETRAIAARCVTLAGAAAARAYALDVSIRLADYLRHSATVASTIADQRLVDDLVGAAESAKKTAEVTHREALRTLVAAELAREASVPRQEQRRALRRKQRSERKTQ